MDPGLPKATSRFPSSSDLLTASLSLFASSFHSPLSQTIRNFRYVAKPSFFDHSCNSWSRHRTILKGECLASHDGCVELLILDILRIKVRFLPDRNTPLPSVVLAWTFAPF